MEPAESVGARLRRLRRHLGLSQRDLAGRDLSHTYISRIESGSRRPSARVLRELAAKLEVTPEYLETGREVGAQNERALRLSDAELELRLGGDTERAGRVFEAVLAEATAAGDSDAVARARIGIGFLAAQRSEYPRAIDEFEQARTSPAVSPLTHPDLYATLARAYAAIDKPERAVALLQACLEDVRSHPASDVTAEIRFATYLSYALSDVGALRQARDVVASTLSRARAGADRYSRVRLYWSLARLQLLEGNSAAALRQIQRAIGLLEATEDTHHLARAYLSCGEILLEQEEPEEAEPQLQLADELLGRDAEVADLGWLKAEQARCAAQRGEAEPAISLATAALALLRENDAVHRAHAWEALAHAHAQRVEVDEADRSFAEAVELLRAARRLPDAARLAQKRARALRAVGRLEAALEVLEEATELALDTARARRDERGREKLRPSTSSNSPNLPTG